MVNITSLESLNAHRWASMHLQASRLKEFHSIGVRLVAPDAKARYQGVTDALIKSGHEPVPWWFVAIISQREADGPPLCWTKQLAQGDPLGQRSHHVPAGRGPFAAHPGDTTPGNDAWTRGCLDALINCNPYAAKWKVWTIGGVLTLFEEYNGLGYAMRGVPSAYVWSGSDQYKSGKFVRDHIYNPNTVDVQDGCAPILATMMAIDPSIKLAA
jgi:lysozyme family protein